MASLVWIHGSGGIIRYPQEIQDVSVRCVFIVGVVPK